VFEFDIPIQPTITNNQAEYEALLRGLQYFREAKAIAVEIFGDSELVIKQLNGQYECRDDILRNYYEECKVLTPKNGTGKGLTCGPSLVMKYHSARKNLLKGIGRGCLRSAARHRSAKGLFALLKGSFRECVVTWPDIRKERVDGVYEMDIDVGALI
jgi:ribonuclease HI